MGSALFIVWRESVEAMLVVGILHAWLKFNATGAAGLRALGVGIVCGLGLAGALGWVMVSFGVSRGRRAGHCATG